MKRPEIGDTNFAWRAYADWLETAKDTLEISRAIKDDRFADLEADLIKAGNQIKELKEALKGSHDLIKLCLDDVKCSNDVWDKVQADNKKALTQ